MTVITTPSEQFSQLVSRSTTQAYGFVTGNPPSGGIWAPCLSHDGKKFYLVYTDVKSKKGMYYNTHNYVVSTEDIYGEWSEPIYLNSIGFDPSLFHDVDGRKYLVNMLFKFKGIMVQEVDPVTFEFIGEQKKVYGGSGLRCTEGPHVYHIGDWYYIIVAEGGTGYEHCVTMARSKSIWGPFETAPDNPILTANREEPAALQKCGHADIVETQDGEWYMVHLCARPVGGQKWCTLGRETAIQKMVWDEDGWMRLAGGGRFAKTEVEEPRFLASESNADAGTLNPGTVGEALDIGAAGRTEALDGRASFALDDNGFHDDFQEDALSVRYSSSRVSYEPFADLHSRKGWLRIRGQEYMNSNHHVSLLAVRQQHACCTVETYVEFEPESFLQMAGLSYIYDSLNFFILGKTVTDEGEPVLKLIRCDRGADEVAAQVSLLSCEEMPGADCAGKDSSDGFAGNTGPDAAGVFLRAQVFDEGRSVRFFYRIGEGEWIQIGGEYSTEILTDEYCRGFTGAHFGMYVHDMVRMEKCADFRYFNMNV